MPPIKRTKAEKRALRQAEQREKAKTRYEATLEPELQKETRSIEIFSVNKLTANVVEGSIYQSYILVNMGVADRSGAWSWGVNRDWDEETAQQIDDFFAGLGEVTWGVLFQEQHHGNRPTTAFCTEAFSRWIDLGYEQFETAFRFRVTGARRIYGIRLGQVFHLIWFDSSHSIMPSTMRNT